MTSLWQHACSIIPGGNQIVSKRPTRYALNYPSHYIYAHGDKIVDAETSKEYIDMGSMGIGCCTLGYGNSVVDSAVIQAIAAGQFSSLNSVEELELAEELLKINPKMDMVRFARTGGEACAVATRIAETYRPGEFFLQHGYSGWYLGSPERSWRGFNFKNTEELYLFENLVDEISYIIMEPVRNYPGLSIELMKETRKFATKYNIPLIFDEITSGFRCNLSGYHITKNIYPDIVVYGKALGNGYAISAVVGKEDIMMAAEKTFISSTLWSERIGFAAALATLSEMKKQRAPDKLIKQGKYIQDEWDTIAADTEVDLEIHGIYPLSGFTFKDYHNKRCTFLTQELLKKGILGSDQFYASLAHSQEDIDTYLNYVNNIFLQISKGGVIVDEVRDKGWRRQN